jgi:hypothetical protein
MNDILSIVQFIMYITVITDTWTTLQTAPLPRQPPRPAQSEPSRRTVKDLQAFDEVLYLFMILYLCLSAE